MKYLSAEEPVYLTWKNLECFDGGDSKALDKWQDGSFGGRHSKQGASHKVLLGKEHFRGWSKKHVCVETHDG